MRLGAFAAAITVVLLFVGCVRRDQAAASDESTGAGAGTSGGSSVAARDGGGGPLAGGHGNATTIDSEAAALAAVGKVVRVSGTAENAKLAGIVVHADLAVYCLDRRLGWGDRSRSNVTVEGLLEHTDEFTVRRQPDGAETAGTDTRVFVIRHCTLQ
jgi:hypothetical protein